MGNPGSATGMVNKVSRNKKAGDGTEIDESARAEAFICEAENSKMLVHRPNGKTQAFDMYNYYEIDDVYCHLGSHIMPGMRKKIEQGEYIDLSKLLERSKITDDDDRMQMINKNGRTYFVPVSKREHNKINCYEKWETAFWIYAGIFSKANPHRAIEIWQHVDNIKDAADEYTWDSVYRYDKNI